MEDANNINIENTEVNIGLARRDFIKKSLMASGGIFVGMAIGEKLITPDLTVLATSKGAASGAPDKKTKGNNGLGNGADPAPPGIEMQGKNQNDDPAVPGQPGYQGTGSGGGNGRNR